MFLGDILRQHRVNMGITQKEMADTLGVAYSFLCKVEKNEKKISVEKLKQISKILDVDFMELKAQLYCDKVINLFSNENDDFMKITLNKLFKSYHV